MGKKEQKHVYASPSIAGLPMRQVGQHAAPVSKAVQCEAHEPINEDSMTDMPACHLEDQKRNARERWGWEGKGRARDSVPRCRCPGVTR